MPWLTSPHICHVERSETSLIISGGSTSGSTEILRFAQNDREGALGPAFVWPCVWQIILARRWADAPYATLCSARRRAPFAECALHPAVCLATASQSVGDAPPPPRNHTAH